MNNDQYGIAPSLSISLPAPLPPHCPPPLPCHCIPRALCCHRVRPLGIVLGNGGAIPTNYGGFGTIGDMNNDQYGIAPPLLLNENKDLQGFAKRLGGLARFANG